MRNVNLAAVQFGFPHGMKHGRVAGIDYFGSAVDPKMARDDHGLVRANRKDCSVCPEPVGYGISWIWTAEARNIQRDTLVVELGRGASLVRGKVHRQRSMSGSEQTE